jgi:hypothetical protein
MRIYGIRDKSKDEVVYVGQTKNLSRLGFTVRGLVGCN